MNGWMDWNFSYPSGIFVLRISEKFNSTFNSTENKVFCEVVARLQTKHPEALWRIYSSEESSMAVVFSNAAWRDIEAPLLPSGFLTVQMVMPKCILLLGTIHLFLSLNFPLFEIAK